MEEDAGGKLLSNPDVPLGQMLEVHGRYRFFVPNVPLGPHRPSDMRMGFIDSGTSRNHPQLLGFVVEERSFVGGPVEDELGHGTAVMLQYLASGAAAANAGLLSAKVTRNGSDLRPEAVLAAFEWLVARHAMIVNMSLGFEKLTPAVAKLCAAIAAEQSVLVVAAAGNFGPSVKVYPASCGAKNVIAVGEAGANGPTASSGAGVVYARPSAFEERWHYLAERGMAALQAGQVDVATKLFRESLDAQESALALSQLALIDARAGRWAQARPLLERAVRLSPEADELVQTLGAVLFALGENDAAIAQFDRALQINPRNQHALLNLTRAWAAKGERDRALGVLQRAQENDPSDPRVGELRASIDSRQGGAR